MNRNHNHDQSPNQGIQMTRNAPMVWMANRTVHPMALQISLFPISKKILTPTLSVIPNSKPNPNLRSKPMIWSLYNACNFSERKEITSVSILEA